MEPSPEPKAWKLREIELRKQAVANAYREAQGAALAAIISGLFGSQAVSEFWRDRVQHGAALGMGHNHAAAEWIRERLGMEGG